MVNNGIEKNNNIVSVIIPMYNGGEHICQCLQNLDEQDTDIEYEVLIVDDKSTDDSVEKTEKIIRGLNNPCRFRLIKCDENGRAGRARNIGVAEASGEYVLFADQDDYPDIRLLRILYELSDHGEYDVISCAVAEDTGEIYCRPSIDVKTEFSFDKKNEFFGKYGYVFASLIRRRILIENNIRFPEKVMFEDVLFNDGMIACTDSIRTIPEVLYYRGRDEGSQTTGLNTKKMNDRVDAAMWYLDHYSENPDMAPYMEGFGIAALFYAYLSCVRWMILSPELFDRDLFRKCVKCARQINPDWKTVFAKEKRIRKIFLYILKIIYDNPKMYNVFKAMHTVKRKIRGY